jgi:excinuclease ABC subunit C
MLKDPKTFLNSLPNKPGVYQMYDKKHEVIYVGKAKNLKKRLTSYFRGALDTKTHALMSEAATIEIIVTPNENTSFLLEGNLIKAKKPYYNIIFKDDKSFPYIHLTSHDYPRLTLYRGIIKKGTGKYFGPFPSTNSASFVIDLLQKIFKLRICQDHFMAHRSRPCMLHQIKLCNAPCCTGYIDKEAYGLQIKLIDDFLQGKRDFVVKELTNLMDQASEKKLYEQAAIYRDQIVSIRKVQTEQAVITTRGNIDVLVYVASDNNICINVLFVRNGLLLGNRTYFPKTHGSGLEDGANALSAFIMHFYLQSNVEIVVPDKILLNLKLPDSKQLALLLSEKLGQKVKILNSAKGIEKQLVSMAEDNASNSLRNRGNPLINYEKNIKNFVDVFKLTRLPKRIECFDVSHTAGELTVASMVVFNEKGPNKNEYRLFNVKREGRGDDYGALQEVLGRRFSEAKALPDVLMIDGGRGQFNVAARVLLDLKLKNIFLLAIAKGQRT